MASLFSFPNPVDEKAARLVAGVVCALALVTLAAGWYWLLVVVAYGFLARTLTGPTLSPLALVASRVIAPRLGPPRCRRPAEALRAGDRRCDHNPRRGPGAGLWHPRLGGRAARGAHRGLVP